MWVHMMQMMQDVLSSHGLVVLVFPSILSAYYFFSHL